MKVFAICATIGAVVFVAMGLQLGLFGNHRPSSGYVSPAEPEQSEKKKAPRAKFPQDLAPAAQAQAVAVAAVFSPGDRPHKMAFLKPTGATHPWHELHGEHDEEWCADRVEDTELVVVVGAAREVVVSYHTYQRTSPVVIRGREAIPPITRYQYELEASLVEAKTGRVLANQKFINMPRPLKKLEAWERTHIGTPVSYQTVFRWAASIARNGAAAQPHPAPIVATVD